MLHFQHATRPTCGTPPDPLATLRCALPPQPVSAEPWLDYLRPGQLYRPVRARWAGDRCSVCDSEIDADSDRLVSCDCCGITVHQICYGITEAPGEQCG